MRNNCDDRRAHRREEFRNRMQTEGQCGVKVAEATQSKMKTSREGKASVQRNEKREQGREKANTKTRDRSTQKRPGKREKAK